MLNTAFSVILALFAITAANLAQRHGSRERTVWMVYHGLVTLGFVYAAAVFVVLLFTGRLTYPVDALAPMWLAAALAIGIVWRCERGRALIKGLLPGLDLDRPVHVMALMLCAALMASVVMRSAAGEVTDRIRALETSGSGLIEIIFSQVIWIGASLLGVGWLTRRSSREVCVRLGLRWPQLSDIRWGILVGLVGLGLIIVFSLIWPFLVTPEVIARDTSVSSAIAARYGMLPAAFALSALVAAGEEILFRGALQPVFGWLLTSGLFLLLHVQYAQSVLLLVLLTFTLLLAWVRSKRSTTAAIIAHFVYNFTQISLWIALNSGGLHRA